MEELIITIETQAMVIAGLKQQLASVKAENEVLRQNAEKADEGSAPS